MASHQDLFLNQILSQDKGEKKKKAQKTVNPSRSKKANLFGENLPTCKIIWCNQFILCLNGIIITTNYSVAFALIRQVTNTTGQEVLK